MVFFTGVCAPGMQGTLAVYYSRGCALHTCGLQCLAVRGVYQLAPFPPSQIPVSCIKLASHLGFFVCDFFILHWGVGATPLPGVTRQWGG